MKINILLLLFIYFIIEIKCRNDKKTKRKEKQKNREEELNVDEGGIMSDEEFEEKLQIVLDEKKIKINQKISKDILKSIFDFLYSREFNLPEIPEDSKGDIDESLNFLNQIFEKLTRSLDYDDEIEVCDIKNWISPLKVKDSVNEIIENLVGMMSGRDL